MSVGLCRYLRQWLQGLRGTPLARQLYLLRGEPLVEIPNRLHLNLSPQTSTSPSSPGARLALPLVGESRCPVSPTSTGSRSPGYDDVSDPCRPCPYPSGDAAHHHSDADASSRKKRHICEICHRGFERYVCFSVGLNCELSSQKYRPSSLATHRNSHTGDRRE